MCVWGGGGVLKTQLYRFCLKANISRNIIRFCERFDAFCLRDQIGEPLGEMWHQLTGIKGIVQIFYMYGKVNKFLSSFNSF